MGIRSALICAIGVAVMSVTSTVGAQGQKNSSGVHNISIPAEPLADALNDLAQQTGLQILFASDLVAKLRSEPLKGSLTADEALRRLLSNTGMSFD